MANNQRLEPASRRRFPSPVRPVSIMQVERGNSDGRSAQPTRRTDAIDSANRSPPFKELAMDSNPGQLPSRHDRSGAAAEDYMLAPAPAWRRYGLPLGIFFVGVAIS